MDLTFVANEDLIAEIVKRTNWVGVIIQSQHQHKSDAQIHNDFNIYSNLNQESIMNILGLVMSKMEVNDYEERKIH